jgi:hypothetical protein
MPTNLFGLYVDYLVAVVPDAAGRPIDAIKGRLDLRRLFRRGGRLISLCPECGQQYKPRRCAEAADGDGSE